VRAAAGRARYVRGRGAGGDELPDLDLPTPPEGFETYAYDGVAMGDQVVWTVITANWETYRWIRA
jgi:hypothetical protein